MNIASGFGVTFGHGLNAMYPVEMCVQMRDEKAAALISGSLNLMKGFSTMAKLDWDGSAIGIARAPSSSRRMTRATGTRGG